MNPSNPKAKHVTPRELRVLKRNVNQPRHDCAQVERDNLDLHAALATAIARIEALNDLNMHGLEYADLLEVLDRTSKRAHNADRTQAASVPSNTEPRP